MSLDPRAVANRILDIRCGFGKETTNLELQKLLYFSHAKHLFLLDAPLVKGVFEAWRNGPVNPSVYRAFKDSGKNAIKKRAKRRDYRTRAYVDFDVQFPQATDQLIQDTVKKLSSFTAWELVELSHAPNGPWDYVVSKATDGVVAGMRISDAITVDRFKYLKRSVGVDHARSSDNVPLTPFEKR